MYLDKYDLSQNKKNMREVFLYENKQNKQNIKDDLIGIGFRGYWRLEERK